jgi:hypothetical protein
VCGAIGKSQRARRRHLVYEGLGVLDRDAQAQPAVAVCLRPAQCAFQLSGADRGAGAHGAVAVAEACSEARIDEGTHLGLRVGEVTDAVGPVVTRGDACVDGFEGRVPDRRVVILGRVGGPEPVQAEVLHCVMGEAAPDRIPHVPVHLDEPRHDDAVGRVDDLGPRRCDPLADVGDLAVHDVDGARQARLRRLDRR